MAAGAGVTPRPVFSPEENMLKIPGRKTSSNVQKVLWCCEEIGLPFEREDIGGEYGGNQTPGYLALNPNGLAPTIDDGGFILWESNSRTRYFAAWPAYHRNAARACKPRKSHQPQKLREYFEQFAPLAADFFGGEFVHHQGLATADSRQHFAAVRKRPFNTLDQVKP